MIKLQELEMIVEGFLVSKSLIDQKPKYTSEELKIENRESSIVIHAKLVNNFAGTWEADIIKIRIIDSKIYIDSFDQFWYDVKPKNLLYKTYVIDSIGEFVSLLIEQTEKSLERLYVYIKIIQ